MTVSHRPLTSRRSVLRGLAVAAIVPGLGACTRVLSEVAGIGADVRVHTDLTTGPHARHRLDLYLPEDLAPETPLVLFLYGGSWRWGSKARYGFVGYALASRGLAVAVADYRLYPEVRFPTFNDDAARAVAWLQANRGRYGLAPGSLHLMGHSAGAHIAALLALDPRYLETHGLSPAELGRFIGLAGPYGVYPSKIDFIADIFPPPVDEANARPVAFAHGEAPSMLLLHGADDSLVSPANSQKLAAAQTAAGGRAAAKIYTGVGHREIILALTPPFRGLAPVLDDAVGFFADGWGRVRNTV